MRAPVLYVLFVFLSIAGARSQKLIFENTGVRNGLPSTEVYHVLQDPKGYIWVFTEYGIVRYDGSRFNHVCKNIPITEREVYAVFQKETGLLYFTNSNGHVYCVKNERAYRIRGVDRATTGVRKRGTNILGVFVDNYNGLYISSPYATYYYPVYKYTIDGNVKDTRFKAPELKYYPYRTLYNKKLVFIDQDKNSYPSGLKAFPKGARVMVKKIDRTFYRTYANTLTSVVNGKEKKSIRFETQIISFEADREKHLWIGLLNGGLIELDRDFKIINHYFDRFTVSAILFDNQNGMWVSTIENGVYHCKDVKMKTYKNIDLLNESISMIKTVNGQLYVGTYKGNLFVKNGETFRRIPIKKSTYAITDMEYNNGQYFVGTTYYFLVLDNNFKVLKVIQCATFGISKIDDEKVVLAFANSVGAYHFKTGVIDKSTFLTGKTRYLSQNRRGECFIITGKGILKMKDFKVEYPEELQKLKAVHVVRIKIDRQDNAWFCSKGEGVYCLTTNNQLIHYNNLPTSFVSDIDFTENGFVVLSTNLGTFVNRRKTINKDSWNLIFKEESLRNRVYKNEIFIGTKFGLSSIRIGELEREKNCNFYLKSIFCNGKPVQVKRIMRSNYDQNNLDLNYDVLNYQSGNNKLEYTLDGPVKLKAVIDETKIQLQNLNPGEYTLKVSPVMTNIKNPNLSITTKIIIRPAFWQTWMFRTVAAILVISIIFLVFWLVNYRRNKRLQEVNQIENLLTEYRLTALKSQVNPHFMSNSLVAIQRLILENETDKANQYIAKFSLLLRSLLEYSNRSTATLKNELTMIELYVELEQLRFNNQFVFEVRIGDDVDLTDIHMPALITQPFVENAIWHGLLPLDGKKEAKLILSIQNVENGILISVTDNGVGRETNKGKMHREFESRGTSLIIQRLENLNRLYNTTGGRVEYIDLKDEFSRPYGTQVNIWLPKEILTQLYVGRN